MNIFKKINKLLIFVIITYLFINFYYFLFLTNILKIQNFTNLNTFLLWLFLGLLYYIIIVIFFFYYIIVTFFFEKFIDNQFDENYKDLEIIQVQNTVRISMSYNNLKLIQPHPFINYYFDSLDLSLNLECELKWINLGWEFFKTIIEVLETNQIIKNYFIYDNNFQFNNTLQSLIELKRLKNKKHQLQLFIKKKSNFDIFFEDVVYEIKNKNDINILIDSLNTYNKNYYLNNNNNNISFYNTYSNNDLIEFKLKLNVIEYLVFSSKKIQPIIEINNENINI